MKVRIKRTSDYNFEKFKEADSLEKIIEYIWRYYNKCDVIVRKSNLSLTEIPRDFDLEIYDDYRE